MTEREVVDLRYHLETLIAMHVEKITQRFEMLDSARALQALEYERRLENLNHAHEQAIKERNLTVSSGEFDTFEKNYNEFRTTTLTRLQEISTRSLTWTAAIGLFVILAGLVIKFLP